MLLIRQNRRYGYIQSSGAIAIEPRFDLALAFSEGRALVRIGRKFGYINESGDLVIDAVYDLAWSFCEGLASASIDGKWGFIRPDGTWAVPPLYQGSTDRFSEGLAFVSVDGVYGCIDAEGNVVVSPQFFAWSSFVEGMAYTRRSPDEPWFYIDRAGRRAFEGTFGWAMEFSQGLAYVETASSRGYIDRQGRFVVAFEPELVVEGDPFREGVAAVAGWFDAESLPEHCRDSDEGTSCYRFINPRGEVAIPGAFYRTLPFSEGLAAVQFEKGGPWGYIDHAGRMVIPARFEAADSFRQGVAWVGSADGERIGYIRRNGAYVWEPRA